MTRLRSTSSGCESIVVAALRDRRPSRGRMPRAHMAVRQRPRRRTSRVLGLAACWLIGPITRLLSCAPATCTPDGVSRPDPRGRQRQSRQAGQIEWRQNSHQRAPPAAEAGPVMAQVKRKTARQAKRIISGSSLSKNGLSFGRRKAVAVILRAQWASGACINLHSCVPFLRGSGFSWIPAAWRGVEHQTSKLTCQSS